jgi:hypothetical protein
MIITDSGSLCRICGKKEAVILCDGYGCGHVDTRVFCPACFDDIAINPYSGKID